MTIFPSYACGSQRARLFLPDGEAGRSPAFSSWPAAWFASVPVSPLRRVVHQRSSQPAPAFQRSVHGLNLLMSSMMDKQGTNVEWEAWPLFAFCTMGLG